jgi:predicted dehydrogenase
MSVRLGIIGCGGIADRRTIREGIVPCPNSELWAVQDIDEEVLHKVGDKYGAKTYYTDYTLLLEDPAVEAVYIATPTHLHFDQVMAAAAAGKHILCEKPLGLTVADCETMIEQSVVQDVKLAVNFMMRYHACHVALKEMVERGDLGKLVMGRAELTCWYPPIPGAFRQDPALGGGGSFIDMGNHCVDLLEQYFGRVKRVSCMTENMVQAYTSEDTAVAMLQFESGAFGVVDALFNVPDAAARNALEIYGSKGSVYSFGTIGQGSGGQLKAVIEQDDKDYDAGQVRESAGEIVIEPEPVNIYLAAIDGFCRAIEDNTDVPVSAEDGLWSQRVMEACYQSAATGKVVTV